MAGSVYETAEGNTIEIGCDGDSLTVNGIKMVLKKDIVTSNGVIHYIDQVLIPDSGKTHLESIFSLSRYSHLVSDLQHVIFMWFIPAKEGIELMGESQSTFGDMVSELGLAAALGPKIEYTLLAPVNTAFTGKLISERL